MKPGIVGRMKQALGVDSLSGLAKALDANLSTVKSWSARDDVPLKWLVRCSEQSGRSLDWLVIGVDPADQRRLESNVDALETAAAWFGPLFDAFCSPSQVATSQPEVAAGAKALRP